MESYVKEQQYYYCDLKDLQLADTLPLHYLWIDFNVFNQENQYYLNKFQQLFEIDAVPDLETLVIRISSLSAIKKIIRIIAASSLTENFYEYIQSNSAIDRAMLFCSKKIKAEQLIKTYRKIKSASYDEKEVIRTVQKWKREETESLYFF